MTALFDEPAMSQDPRPLRPHDDPSDWVECWQCGGEGSWEDCFEDTCMCLDPPCVWTRCDVCRDEGGWSHPPDGGPAPCEEDGP